MNLTKKLRKFGRNATIAAAISFVPLTVVTSEMIQNSLLDTRELVGDILLSKYPNKTIMRRVHKSDISLSGIAQNGPPYHIWYDYGNNRKLDRHSVYMPVPPFLAGAAMTSSKPSQESQKMYENALRKSKNFN